MQNRFILALTALIATATSNVFAALPGGLTTGVTEIKADLASVVDAVWPVIIAAVAAVVVMKLFKRFTSKI